MAKRRPSMKAALNCNDRIYAEYHADHPARKFLMTFYDVRKEVCGRDIEFPNRPAIDQSWTSRLLSRPFSFSSYAYCFVSYTLTLGEWCDESFAAVPSPSEQAFIARWKLKHALLGECLAVATEAGNREIVRFVALARSLLDLQMAAIAERIKLTDEEILDRWGVSAEAAAQSWLKQAWPADPT